MSKEPRTMDEDIRGDLPPCDRTTSKMSDTPRTDEQLRESKHGTYHVVPAQFARELERELDAAQRELARIERLYEKETRERDGEARRVKSE